MPRLSAHLGWLFLERPLIERFGAAAAAGFQAVELQCPYDVAASAVKAELDKHNLKMLGLNTATGRDNEFGITALPGRERDFDRVFRQALDYAVAIGGRSVHCLAGCVPQAQRTAAEATFVANLTRAADLAAEQNMLLLIEPINPRDRPDYFLTRVEHAAAIVAKVGRPNVRIQFDFYHAQIVGGDLITRFEVYRSVIGHVQIAGNPSRHEPDEGEVNYTAILEMLDRTGYPGWVGCEYRPRTTTEAGLGWARAYGVMPHM